MLFAKSWNELSEVEKMLIQEVQQEARIGRGFHNKASANGGIRGNYLTVSSLMRGFEIAPCKITKNGKTVEVPTSWMTKNGAIKKSKRGALEALFL